MDVSFLIPVRDARSTLPAAVASVLQQTVPVGRVVVVDDGSSDGTGAWLDAQRDPRLHVIHTQRRGIALALRTGLEACCGEFVARMDADDVAHPERLARQLPLFTDPSLAVVDGRMAWSAPVPEGMRRHAEWINDIVEPEDFARTRFFESGVVHPAATLRRAALEIVGGYREGDHPEDFDLWLRLHGAGYRFRKVPEVLVTMRDHPGRATRSDARYRRAAFRSVAEEHLARQVLAKRRRIVQWGAGRGGRPWLRWLLERGQVPFALIDIDPRKIGRTRQGVPVHAPAALRTLDLDLLLVTVGRRDALPLIRAELARVRPDLREGREWWPLVCG